jgi:hypothetical protein
LSLQLDVLRPQSASPPAFARNLPTAFDRRPVSSDCGCSPVRALQEIKVLQKRTVELAATLNNCLKKSNNKWRQLQVLQQKITFFSFAPASSSACTNTQTFSPSKL